MTVGGPSQTSNPVALPVSRSFTWRSLLVLEVSVVKSWHANVRRTQLNAPPRPLSHLQHHTRRHAITDPWGNLKESQLLWSVDCYRRLEIGQCCFSDTVRLMKRLLSVGVWPHMYDEYVGYRWLFFAATVSGWITERILWATALQRWLETSCCMLVKGQFTPCQPKRCRQDLMLAVNLSVNHRYVQGQHLFQTWCTMCLLCVY